MKDKIVAILKKYEVECNSTGIINELNSLYPVGFEYLPPDAEDSGTATDHTITTPEISEYVSNRITQLKYQSIDPEIVDQKRVQCKLEAYQEISSKLAISKGAKPMSEPIEKIIFDYNRWFHSLTPYLKGYYGINEEEGIRAFNKELNQ